MAFQKGQSGNPGGRPKFDAEIRALAQQHCTAAIERLVLAMKNEDDRIATAAASAILDRGIGKPAQAVTVAGDAANPLQARVLVELVRNTNAEGSVSGETGTAL